MLSRIATFTAALLLLAVASASHAATPPDTLVIGYNRAANNLLPGQNPGLPNIWANMLIYDCLVIHDGEGKIHPGLAERWELAKDGVTWTFHLRKDVTFHSGRKFTAKDVKAHFDMWKTLPTASKIAALDRTEIVDDYTVRFVLKYPTLVFLNMISQTEWSYCGIPDSEQVAKYGKDYGVVPESVSGTGPFKLVRWIREDRLEFERNPAYTWGPAFYKNRGPAHIQKVVIRSIADAAARTAALERGEIDMDISLSEFDAKRLSAMKGLSVIVKPKNTTHNLGFNHDKPLWKDVRVRQALMYAIDQKPIVEAVFAGYAQPAIGLFAPSVEGSAPDDAVRAVFPGYNPEKAKALLDEAGWKPGPDGIRVKDGQRLAFNVFVYSEPQANTLTVIQEQWRAIGAEATIRQMEYAAWIEATKKGEHDIRYVDGTHSTADIAYWYTCAARPHPNNIFWCDPTTEKLYEITQKTTDPAARVKAFQDLELDLIKRAVLIPMPHTAWVVGVWDSVKDLELHPIHGYYKLLDARKAR
ncbi:MAG TPA: ABC transporter substrate-binding protein [Thermodesulfobacteriota bacterium]